jgi:hypothetical protein
MEVRVRTVVLCTAAALGVVFLVVGGPDEVAALAHPGAHGASSDLEADAGGGPGLRGTLLEEPPSSDASGSESAPPPAPLPTSCADDGDLGPAASWIRGTVTAEDGRGVPGVAITAVLGRYG